jgi:hypothetical protein
MHPQPVAQIARHKVELQTEKRENARGLPDRHAASLRQGGANGGRSPGNS